MSRAAPVPVRLGPADDMTALHALLVRAFAYMDGRIDPPSSLGRMTAETFAQEAREKEVWAIPGPSGGAGPSACMVLEPRADHLYLGKLAVAGARRGQGLARVMIEHAVDRARALGLPEVRLQTRVELDENHRTFIRLGFVEVGRTAHPGYDRPTSVTFARQVGEGPR